MLENNIIRHSSSAFSVPIVIVPKKNGDIIICIDYRKLNQATKRPIFHTPSAQEIFDKLGWNSYFTTLDLSKGYYYQICMDEKDVHKTAFSSSQGHFEFIRMPFGLNGAPATFQRALTSTLSSFVGESCCVYLDDTIVYGRDEKEHDKQLDAILEVLYSSGWRLSKEICVFKQNSVSFLGHIIDREGIKTYPEKICKIKQ